MGALADHAAAINAEKAAIAAQQFVDTVVAAAIRAASEAGRRTATIKSSALPAFDVLRAALAILRRAGYHVDTQPERGFQTFDLVTCSLTVAESLVVTW
jgi:hypothetical protein